MCSALDVYGGRRLGGRVPIELVHARRRNRTIERLTCVGGPVVYRTGIICPPAIARLNYSSRDEPEQTLHCFNRSPIIRQLLELQPTVPLSRHGTIRPIGTRLAYMSAYKAAFHRCTRLFVANYASACCQPRTFHSYDCRRSIIAPRQKEYALAARWVNGPAIERQSMLRIL